MTPFEFELMGRTVTVQLKAAGFFNDPDCCGVWDLRAHVISILDDIPEAQQEQAFYHEFCHAAFDVLGYDALSEDERLVDLLGSLMQQMISTRREA
jgi:hypothetical protein